jgi:hypothetical protein
MKLSTAGAREQHDLKFGGKLCCDTNAAHVLCDADLQELDSVDASTLLKSKKVRVVAGSVNSDLSGLQNVADGFKKNLL